MCFFLIPFQTHTPKIDSLNAPLVGLLKNTADNPNPAATSWFLCTRVSQIDPGPPTMTLQPIAKQPGRTL